MHKQGTQSKREEIEKVNLNEKFDEDDEEEESDDISEESAQKSNSIDDNILNKLSDLELENKGE